MLINFSHILELPMIYLSCDELEILEEIKRIEREEEYAAV